MRTIDLDIYDLVSNGEAEVVVLGDEAASTDKHELNLLMHRVKDKIETPITGIWGTLGWADDKPFTISGSLHLSAIGNEASEGVTLKQIQNIRSFNPRAKEGDFRVLERFINLDDVDFGVDGTWDYGNLPELKLTLMVSNDEGAIVYYQKSEKNKHNDHSAIVDYILPEKMMIIIVVIE